MGLQKTTFVPTTSNGQITFSHNGSASPEDAEIARLRGWLTEIANCKAENSLAEVFARKVRYLARRALQGGADA